VDKLKAHIHTFVPFSEESWELLQECISVLEFKKNQPLLRAGEVCTALFFVIKGLCKSCYERDGKEINTAFFFENDFAANVKSLTSSTTSEYAIVACEATVVCRLDKSSLLRAYMKSHEIESFGRKTLEKITIQQEEQLHHFQLLTPRERFERLVAEHPEFLQRISLTQIASYLGMSRETLSRLRALK